MNLRLLGCYFPGFYAGSAHFLLQTETTTPEEQIVKLSTDIRNILIFKNNRNGNAISIYGPEMKQSTG
jgi:hypothetical protein